MMHQQGRIKRSRGPGQIKVRGRKSLKTKPTNYLWEIKVYIDITIKQKFYKIYQTQVWVVLKKILMLTTNFYFYSEFRSKKLSPICNFDLLKKVKCFNFVKNLLRN